MKGSNSKKELRENYSPPLQHFITLQRTATARRHGRNRIDHTSNVLCDISGRSNNSGNKQITTVHEEQPAQICFDFTKGRCARRNCKFSHDFEAIVQYNSREKGICFDFLRGECSRGPLCRFSHDLSNVMKQWMHEMRVGNTSRFSTSGICYDFVRGQCPRGKKCRFSHDLREIALATSRQQNENSTNSSTISWDRNSPSLSSRSSTDFQRSNSARHADSQTRKNDVFVEQKLSKMTPIWKENKERTPLTTFRRHISSGGSGSVIAFRPSNRKVQYKTSKLTAVPISSTTAPLPLSNIRSRQLLGSDLCQVIGLPTLNSSLALTW